METIDKTNQINGYLNKNYCVKEHVFFDKYSDQQEWGSSIADSLRSIFSFESDFCNQCFTNWACENGLDDEQLKSAWGKTKLNVSWSPEMAQDVSAFYNIDAEAELTAILADEISAEIDAQILRDLRGRINSDELIGVVKCLGYELSDLVYDPNTFTPLRSFVSTTYNETLNERQNNTIWQDWVRTRG